MTEKNLKYYQELFYCDWSSSDDVRDNANEEFRFLHVSGGQWEGWLEDNYEDRAKLEINHLSEYMRRTYSQYTTARPSVNYSPVDDGDSSKDLAELMDGMYRRDIHRNGGLSAQDTAVFEAMSCGYGAEILNVEWDDEGDPDNEYQNIVATEQPNAYSTVVFDSSARRADKSDARHCTVLTPYSKKEFERLYPDSKVSTVTGGDRASFNWGTTDLVYVATCYEKVTEKTHITTYAHPETKELFKITKDQGKEAEELALLGYKPVRERVIKKHVVHKTVYSGAEILQKPKRIAGEYIPVIPYYGFRGYVDGLEYFHGLARERMDVQRVLNMCYSLAGETASTATEDTPIFYADQMASEAVRQSWSQNRSQQAFRIIDPMLDSAGNIITTGAIQYQSGGRMSEALMSLIQMSAESIQRGTGGAPQDIADPNASGKAIQALIKRIDQNTEIIFDNIDKAIKHKGRVYASIAKEIYGSPVNSGRMVRIPQESGETTPVTLRSVGAKDGRLAITNDISSAKMEVCVNISEDYATKREETFESLKDITDMLSESDPLRAIVARKLIILKEASGLGSLQDKIRQELLLSGYEQAETEEDQAFIQQALQAQGAQAKDPNTLLLEQMAKEQATQAQANQAATADKMASAVKKAAEAEETKVDTAIKKSQLSGQFTGEPRYTA
jgi:hypothetical protein